MATYDYNSYVVYTRNGQSNNASEAYTIGEVGTLDDGQLDNTFTAGVDSIGGGTYYGYYVVGNRTYVVVQMDANTFRFYGDGDFTTSQAELPSPIDIVVDITQADMTPCFLAGTMIAVPGGETPVENLSTGDMILTADGREVAVKWVGHKRVSTRFAPVERLEPVRFDAGALGGDMPKAPLTVTADHALLIDGVLCEAGALVNGVSICRVPLSRFEDGYTVYHVETENHEIIVAEGTPAETFIDNVSRAAFDNFAEFEEMYGDAPEMKELDYPRASRARHLPQRIRAMVAAKLAS